MKFKIDTIVISSATIRVSQVFIGDFPPYRKGQSKKLHPHPSNGRPGVIVDTTASSGQNYFMKPADALILVNHKQPFGITHSELRKALTKLAFEVATEWVELEDQLADLLLS